MFSSLKTWGWITLILGVIEILAAMSLFSGGGFGRWIGIFAASLVVIDALLDIRVLPFWSICVFALSVIVVYQLASARKCPRGFPRRVDRRQSRGARSPVTGSRREAVKRVARLKAEAGIKPRGNKPRKSETRGSTWAPSAFGGRRRLSRRGPRRPQATVLSSSGSSPSSGTVVVSPTASYGPEATDISRTSFGSSTRPSGFWRPLLAFARQYEIRLTLLAGAVKTTAPAR